MSPTTQALVINAAVLLAILEADLGPHRKIGPFRILRPILAAGAIVPLFVKNPATSGAGLSLEIAGVVAGLLGGALAASTFRVYRSPRTGRPVTRAGWAYAAVWTVIIGARAAFSYGSTHWFAAPLGGWMRENRISGDALTDALLLMAVAMMVTRTAVLATRTRNVLTAEGGSPALQPR
ncbi:hypothetical protein ACFWWS_15145 [Streptomyces sp. NPDC059083]|uniref:hypothetical protein n=1 Tax=unclassified Streptomyces TaxID=2593676 RepID=UPI00367B2D18